VDTETRKYMPNKVRRRKQRRQAKEEARERREAVARARFVKVAPRKTRLVVDAIRGKTTEEALNILRFTPKKAARVLEKVIQSAIANAENNFMLDPERLFIHRAFVDGGPIIRRWRPRAMGRATPIRRRTSHITIVVKERGEIE